jgi:hypothetical protein
MTAREGEGLRLAAALTLLIWMFTDLENKLHFS